MSKAKQSSKKIIIIIVVLLLLAIFAGVFFFMQTKNYVGAYNLDDRYSIVLKRDGTCDFTESGASAYTNTALKCFYKVDNTDVTIEKDVRRFKWVGSGDFGGSSSWGDVWKPGSGCAEYSNKSGNCDEEIIRIQETAIIGDTGMIYKDKVYIKLK